MITLRQRLIAYLKKNPTWWNGGKLEELAMSVGYKGSSASRELRQLEVDGIVEREMRKGVRVRSVWYRYKII